jgi:aryl-phospho-beta-D-glucosidase BglC (GH1 family)
MSLTRRQVLSSGTAAIASTVVKPAIGVTARNNFTMRSFDIRVSNGVFRNTRFGVALSGPENAPWTTVQAFPSAADFTYLASKGVTFVRLPVAWESLQPTLSAALNTTYLNNIKTAIDNAHAAGIGVIVDLHNFALYCTQSNWTAHVNLSNGYAGNLGTYSGGNTYVLGDSTLTQAAFVDVWTRLATALVGRAGLVGYELMNEPQHLVMLQYAPGTNLITTPNGLGSPWWSVYSGTKTQLANGTNPLGANYAPAWRCNSTSWGGVHATNIAYDGTSTYAASCWAWTDTGTVSLTVDFSGTFGSNQTITTTPTRYTWTAIPAAHAFNGYVSWQIQSASAASCNMINFQCEKGTSATAFVPNVLYPFYQAAINAVRAIDATTPIHIDGLVPPSGGTQWGNSNYDLANLTGGNLIFDLHNYFDAASGESGMGIYSGTYDSYGTTLTAGANSMAGFANWCTATGCQGCLGEFGVPNDTTDNDQNWLVVLVNVLNTLKSDNLTGILWNYGCGRSRSNLSFNPVASVDDARLLDLMSVQ